MPFATVAVPFDSYRSLPSPQHRWLLTCLARYADRDGRCWPSMRQLAADARMSLASVSRYLASLARVGCFIRHRKPGGRYRYTLADVYRPRWSGGVPPQQAGVPQRGNQKAYPEKHKDKEGLRTIHEDDSRWEARLRGWQKRRMWLPFWGPKPTEPGCWAPAIQAR